MRRKEFELNKLSVYMFVCQYSCCLEKKRERVLECHLSKKDVRQTRIFEDKFTFECVSVKKKLGLEN